MYDELVKALRNNADHYGFVGENVLVHLLTNAADAIEELNLVAESYRRSAKAWADTAAAAVEQIPHWIRVTERKPKTDDIVIVAIHDDSGDTPYDVTNVGFYLDVFPLGVWVVDNERCNYVTHWMPLPEPPKEG